MAAWKEFEFNSTEYLNQTFKSYAIFYCKGGSNSNISDIEVLTKSGKRFYIEAKHSPAQCGQFVLFPNLETKSFEYSCSNATEVNIYSKAIIEHMTWHFDEFKNATTAGKEINMKNGTANETAPFSQENKGFVYKVSHSDTYLLLSFRIKLKLYFQV